jgi:hypothetical protein
MSIYFIACGGFIKVGYSDDPVRRTARLFSSTSAYTAPRAAYEARGSQELLGYIYGDKADERRLQQALDDYAVGCEWFVDEPELRAYLSSLPEDGGIYYPPLKRAGGAIAETLPVGERGGCNADLALRALERRRSA